MIAFLRSPTPKPLRVRSGTNTRVSAGNTGNAGKPFRLAVQARMRRFSDPKVASLFKAYPPAARARLMALRDLVLDTAAKTTGVGRLTETLKWGQPSYLTEETGSGTTVRIDRLKSDDGYAIYYHCQSGLVGQFRDSIPTPSSTKANGQCTLLRRIACRPASSGTALRSP